MSAPPKVPALASRQDPLSMGTDIASPIGALRLGPDIALPPDAASQTFAILAVRGAGKSNAVVVFAEEMYAADIPWVAIDAKGDWHGIRSSEDGNGPGLPIPIFGGLHGDLPLSHTSGRLVADLIVDENLTCVLDISEFSTAQAMHFLVDLGERLYSRHGRDPQVRHIFMEEADQYVPQRTRKTPGAEEGKTMVDCLTIWSKIVKLGRSRGLGMSVVSQRSAVVTKDILSQCESLIALRTTGTHDRQAIYDWMDYHAVARQLVNSLPTLETGEAWVCSRLVNEGEPLRCRFRRRRTFDSGSTPLVGTLRRPSGIADIDLGSLADRISALVDTAAADDPAVLHQRIETLEKELAEAKSSQERIEVLTFPAEWLDGFASLAQDGRKLFEMMAEAGARARPSAEIAAALVPRGIPASEAAAAFADNGRRTAQGRGGNRRSAGVVDVVNPGGGRVTKSVDTPTGRVTPDGKLPKAERSILTVLAQFPAGRTRQQLAMLSGYSAKSGGFGNALAKLRTAGLITRGEPIRATEEGTERVAGSFEPLPSGPALLEHWNAKLGKAARLILEALVDAWPVAMSRDDLAEATGYSASSGGFGNALAHLRTLELITRGAAILADETLAIEVRS